MVVMIHGGPSSLTTPEWPARFRNVASHYRGAFHPRLFRPPAQSAGSYGQGEEFTRANVKDFGGGDLRDILAGVDAAIARYPIDPAPRRDGLELRRLHDHVDGHADHPLPRGRGRSRHRQLAKLLRAEPDRSVDDPVLRASVYDDPAVYAKSSPIHFIKNVKTPTLIVVGERDAERPAPQSYEFWHALRTLGVPTQLMVYPGEGHLFIQA